MAAGGMTHEKYAIRISTPFLNLALNKSHGLGEVLGLLQWIGNRAQAGIHGDENIPVRHPMGDLRMPDIAPPFVTGLPSATMEHDDHRSFVRLVG